MQNKKLHSILHIKMTTTILSVVRYEFSNTRPHAWQLIACTQYLYDCCGKKNGDRYC